MTIVCGKFFFHKQHRVPDADEILNDIDNCMQNKVGSSSCNKKKSYPNLQFTYNDNESTKNNLHENNDYKYSKSCSNWNDSIYSQMNNQKTKKRSIHLNMNYNVEDDTNSSKALKNLYFRQPADSFFANKLAKEPESKIKTHHHKPKKNVDYLPEIPKEILNRRINYQYSSPSNEIKIKSSHKKHNHKKGNNNIDSSANLNRLGSPENLKRNNYKDKLKVDEIIMEEEEEYENDRIENNQLINKSSNYTSSHEEYNKLAPNLSSEEGVNIDNNQNIKFISSQNSAKNNSKNYSNYSNSYKSTSSYQNEEEEFQANQISTKKFDQLKDSKKTIATSPFYKPNYQFQQFNSNEEISKLSQSQVVRPPQNSQPKNLSRSFRIKAAAKTKNNDYLSNEINNSEMFQNSFEHINSQNFSPNQGKSNSPKNGSENLYSNIEKKKNFPDSSSKKDFLVYENSEKQQINDEQRNSNSFKNKSPKTGSSHKVFSPQDILNSYDQQNSSMNTNKLQNSYSPKNFISQNSNDQIDSNFSKRKSPKSNSSHKFSSSKNSLELQQVSNDLQYSGSIKNNSQNSSKRKLTNNFESFNSLDEQVKSNLYGSKSPKTVMQHNNLGTPPEQQNPNISKKKSPNSNSSLIKSGSPQISDNSERKKSSNSNSKSNSPDTFSYYSQTKSDSFHSDNEKINSQVSQKKGSSSHSSKNSSSQSKSDYFRSENEKIDQRADNKKASYLNSDSIKNISSSQNQNEEEEDEPVFFERLQLSDKDPSNSERYESDKQVNYNDENVQYLENNDFGPNEEEDKPKLSDNESFHNYSVNNDENLIQNKENKEFLDFINDLIIEEEEEENEVNDNQMKNEEKSFVVLSELQNNGEISPLPKKKSSEYPVSFNQFSADSINENESETEINNSLVQIFKSEDNETSKNKKNDDDNVNNKSIILTNEEIEIKSDDEISNSVKSFSSISPSDNNANGNHSIIDQSTIKQSSIVYQLNEEEEDYEKNGESLLDDENLNLLDSRISSNEEDEDDNINTIQDVVFEEDFNIIPNDSNLLDSDVSDDAEKESNHNEDIVNADVDIVIQNSNKKKKNSNEKILNVSNNLFSDSNTIAGFNKISRKPKKEEENSLSLRNNNNINGYDDIHSSEIRFLLESSSEPTIKQEEGASSAANDDNYKEIQCLSPKYLKEAHMVNLGDDEEEEGEIDIVEVVDDSIKKEEKKNCSFDVLFDNCINSSFERELNEAYRNSFSNNTDNNDQKLDLNFGIISDDLKMIFNSIKFNHPGIRFGLENLLSFSDRLLKRELDNIFI